MQLYSLRFKEKISDYLDQSSIYAGTISSVYEDDFTRKELARDEVVLLQATTENREDMKEILSCLAKNFPLLDKLPSEVSAKFFGMACEYARTQSHVQLRKLFNNALVYVAEDKVFTKGNGNYKVQGNTREHVVYHNEKKGMACDCDLFTGQGAYKNQPAECSHIQAVQLVKGK